MRRGLGGLARTRANLRVVARNPPSLTARHSATSMRPFVAGTRSHGERAVRPRAPPFIDPPGYARHWPEETLLYQIVKRHYPEFVATREAAGRPLLKYVQEEFAAYLQCGRLEHG
jgi:hypothetical protein